MKPEDLREQLLAAAHRTPSPEIDTERVRTRVRRRRAARYTAVAGAGLAVAAAVVLNTLPSASTPETKTPADSSIRQPSAASSAAPGLPDHTCGASIPASSGRGAVTVRISDVRAAPDGAPQVTYAVHATAPAVLSGGPLVLVLKDGRVVAGQDPSGPASENTAHQVTITPDHPHRARLAPVPGRPCAGTAWSSVWKGGYEVAVVLIAQQTVPSGTRAPDSLIVARAPLSE
ncbi:hypothetical protein [Streptomyces sp. HUAS TT20]|uniref:hypothetical protein n=1 Tax=Streptomyces sp. HUAS TT20 TaxID=3447509 RepID=UPI0021D90245|nr:hypothetical protein [Streptomyces sp. HUAS 15-9]UXY27742.1 hypothetical protein N8I87_14925 [Streptomyces sp. HUAS 15-9]